jgi:low temperature requirement protein LtrA
MNVSYYETQQNKTHPKMRTSQQKKKKKTSILNKISHHLPLISSFEIISVSVQMELGPKI